MSTSTNVFDAIITGDQFFYETKNVKDLLLRLLKSCDTDYKVTDMATVLRTISMLEEIYISPTDLVSTRLARHLLRLRGQTTNNYLLEKLTALIKKLYSMLAEAPIELPARSEIRQ